MDAYEDAFSSFKGSLGNRNITEYAIDWGDLAFNALLGDVGSR